MAAEHDPAREQSAGEGLAGKTIGGYVWSLSGTGAQMLLRLAVLAVLGRVLLAEDFGVVGAALVIVAAATMVGQIGVAEAIVQRPELDDDHLSSGLVLAGLFGLGVAALIIACAPLVAAYFRMPILVDVLRLLSIQTAVRIACRPQYGLMARQLRFRELATVHVIAYGVGYAAVAIPLALAGFGVWSLAWGIVAQGVIEGALLVRLSGYPMRPGFTGKAAKDLLWFGGGASGLHLANLIVVQADRVVLGRLLGAEALGLYTRAFQLFWVPARLFTMGGNLVLFPVMSSIQDDDKRMAAASRRGLALTALLILPASGVLFVLTPEAIRVLYGPGWEGAIPALRALCLGMYFWTTWGVTLSAARARGTVYQAAWRQFGCAVCVVIGIWFAAPYGLGWVGLAVSVGFMLQFVGVVHLMVRSTGPGPLVLLKAHLSPLLVTGIGLGTCWLVASALRGAGQGALVILIGGSVAAVTVAGLAALALPRVVIGSDGLWFLDKLRGVVKRHLGRRRSGSPTAGGDDDPAC